jgi:hypothetical protein
VIFLSPTLLTEKEVMMNRPSTATRPIPIPSRPLTSMVSLVSSGHIARARRGPSPGSSPPSAAPFSTYGGLTADDQRDLDLPPVSMEGVAEVVTAEERLRVTRNSVLSSDFGDAGVRSTSSSVSSGGRTIGRPMGIPPPESPVAPTPERGRGSLSGSSYWGRQY